MILYGFVCLKGNQIPGKTFTIQRGTRRRKGIYTFGIADRDNT